MTCRGQLIGLLLADNEMLAKQAAKQVHISYKELPSVLTIQVRPWHGAAIMFSSCPLITVYREAYVGVSFSEMVSCNVLCEVAHI